MEPSAQLPLSLRLDAGATLDNFYPGERSREAFAAVHEQLPDGQTVICLHGQEGSGRSHLLQAACHAAAEAGHTGVYLPLSELAAAPPAEVLDGLGASELLCLDDVDAVAGDRAWEEALFHCFNQLRGAGNRLLAASTAPPAALQFVLPDWRSRLASGAVYQLRAPAASEQLMAMQHRADRLGLKLSADVARYILARARRDTASLMALMDELDRHSLAGRRRLTIPFVRSVFNW